MGGEYSKFTATIDPVSYFGTASTNGVQLRVLADDELVYSSPTITYRTDDLEVSVDIKNADYLAFELVYVGGTEKDYWGTTDPILICNATVSK